MTKKQIISILAIIFAAYLLLFTSILVKKNRTLIKWDGNAYNIENVNPLDAKFAHPYSKVLDDTGDFFVYFANQIVGIVMLVYLIKAKDKMAAFKTLFYDCVIFGICWVYAISVYSILKTLAGRIRPYMYFMNPSLKGVEEGDFFRSWPSSHSTIVWMAFAFLMVWYNNRKPDCKFKKLVLIASALVCVTTMILRMLSGNHFLTDVLSGAVLGFAISYAVSQLFYKIYGKEM